MENIRSTNGRIDNLEDRIMLENVRNVFQFHKTNEKYFFRTHSANRVLLLTSGDEYKGLFEFLTENHFMFDVMNSAWLGSDEMPRPLDSYELLILPDIRNLNAEQFSMIDRFVEEGGKILSTGLTSLIYDNITQKNIFRLSSLGVLHEPETYEKEMGIYYRIFEKDKYMLGHPDLKYLDLVYAWEEGLHCTPDAGIIGLLGFIPPAMTGSPEKCYYTEVTDIP